MMSDWLRLMGDLVSAVVLWFFVLGAVVSVLDVPYPDELCGSDCEK